MASRAGSLPNLLLLLLLLVLINFRSIRAPKAVSFVATCR
jgi:hypothetical protein